MGQVTSAGRFLAADGAQALALKSAEMLIPSASQRVRAHMAKITGGDCVRGGDVVSFKRFLSTLLLSFSLSSIYPKDPAPLSLWGVTSGPEGPQTKTKPGGFQL